VLQLALLARSPLEFLTFQFVGDSRGIHNLLETCDRTLSTPAPIVRTSPPAFLDQRWEIVP
jgi:hypothetical protein